MIILSSRKYIMITRLVGRNAVKVVATLSDYLQQITACSNQCLLVLSLRQFRW